MPLKLLAVNKSKLEPLRDLFLLRREPVRIPRIYGRKITAYKRVRLSVKLYRFFLIINKIEHEPVVHLKLRMPLNKLSLKLHLYHEYRLMDHLVHIHVVAVIFLTGPYSEGAAV